MLLIYVSVCFHFVSLIFFVFALLKDEQMLSLGEIDMLILYQLKKLTKLYICEFLSHLCLGFTLDVDARKLSSDAF